MATPGRSFRLKTRASSLRHLAAGYLDRETAYRLLAASLSRRARDGKPRPVWLARAMIGAAPSRVHLEVARELHEALVEGAVERVRSIARTARHGPDCRAEKIVSHRYRFLWICNPKVASRSLIAALRAADPDARLIRSRTIAAVHLAEPRSRDYLSFAFVRDPYERAHSFHADKIVRAGENPHDVVGSYHGVTGDSDFGAVCAWLNTPYGADAFADRHWLSQHRQIRLPTGGMPDFVGRHERLEADLRAVAERLGMPAPVLPTLNTMSGWRPDEALARSRRRLRGAELSAGNRALLRRRYAADFDLLGYRP